MATAENAIDRPLRVEPRASLKDQWAERARARNLITPVDLSDFPDEPPIYMRKLRGSEIHLWQAEFATEEGDESGRNARIIALCASDENGAPVMTAEDALGLPADLFVHLFRAALKTIGSAKEGESDLGKTQPTGDSSAGSP